MTNEELVLWLRLVLPIAGIFLAWDFYRHACIYAARQDLYAIRDSLFLEYAKRGLSHQSRGYVRMREFLHHCIRNAHVFGPMLVFGLFQRIKMEERVGIKRRTVRDEIVRMKLADEEAQLLLKAYEGATLALTTGVLRRTLVFQGMFWILKFIRACTNQRARFYAAISDRIVRSYSFAADETTCRGMATAA